MKRDRLRLLESEVGAVTKQERGESLSSTERGALRRLRRVGPPSRESAIRIAVEEAAAYEWLTEEYDVHEQAVRAHVEAMGSIRGERLVEDLARIDWKRRNPFLRIRIPLDSRGRGWAAEIIRALGARKGDWATVRNLDSELRWTVPRMVRARRRRQLEREDAVEISPDGKSLRLTPLGPRLEAMLRKNDPRDDALTKSIKAAFKKTGRSRQRETLREAIRVDERFFLSRRIQIESRRPRAPRGKV